VVKGVPALVIIATLYPDNPAHSILAPIGCKAFKLIQDRGTCKLIIYYESWADLEKVIGKPFSLDEFTGDWMRLRLLAKTFPKSCDKFQQDFTICLL
jgi:hypothetical protein